VTALCLIWGPLVVVTGGFGFRLGPLSIFSRHARNPLIIALLLIVVAWALAPAGRRHGTIARDFGWLGASLGRGLGWLRDRSRRWEAALVARSGNRIAAAAATTLAVAVVAIGFREGALVAGGSDAWGYVSQAELWARGDLRIEQPLLRELTREIPAEAFAPLAYRPSVDRTTIVPVVAPGLPLLMALFLAIGGREAVFAVVPLLAGVAVLATYLLGTNLAGAWTGVAAAALLAASPSFLFQLTSSPMSDIPATAWWALSLALLLSDAPPRALASGVAAGAAILTRANLAPLAIIPGILLVLCPGRSTSRPRWLPVALFAAGIVPVCVAIAGLNTYWYGSPFRSGYGSVDEIYAWRNIAPNLERYPRWLLESQTPFVLLALVAPWLLRRRAEAAGLLAFAIVLLACYLAYIPFDAWWFLRFLLPGYPALLTLAAAAMLWGAQRLPSGLRVVSAVATVMVIAWHGVTYATAQATFYSESEMKYAVAGRYVADHLPERAVLLAIQHSGSARYYSGRTTIRPEFIPADKLEWTLAEIRRHGYVPYALFEDWEVPAIEDRFRGRPAAAVSRRPPLADLPLGNVRIYAFE
jgi:hypothetical protein